MLVIVTTPDTRLDAGAVGLALARRWSAAGDSVLLCDGATNGSTLPRRLGEALRTRFSPADRGLPSLIVARDGLNLSTLARHCYSLESAKGSLWALFGPANPEASRLAAEWLVERANEVKAVDAERHVILATSLNGEPSPLIPLMLAAEAVVVVAPAEDADAARSLRQMCRDAGLTVFDRNHRLLVVEGTSALSDEDLHIESGLRVAGRLQATDDERLWRDRPRRAGIIHPSSDDAWQPSAAGSTSPRWRPDKATSSVLDSIAMRVRTLIGLYGEDERSVSDAVEPVATSRLRKRLKSRRRRVGEEASS